MASVEGVAPDGTTFTVPHTCNVIQTMLKPTEWNAATFLTFVIVAVTTIVTAADLLPLWGHIALFLFWRFMYNIGLGVILHNQSRHSSVVNWYKRSVAKPDSTMGRFVGYLARSACPTGYKPDKFPAVFNAWVVYRLLVDVILCNDVWSYCMVMYKCFVYPPPTLTLIVVLQYLAGFALVVFNYWAKVDAHRCIGNYCWYWGDFFFLKNENLTFDGIFELFPHPMYTVGYAFYYGSSLISRSYTMLFVSMFAHMLQMGFLMLVEEPHIERIYGTSNNQIDRRSLEVLYDPAKGYFDREEPVLWIDLRLYRSTDLAVLCFIVYGLLSSVVLSPWACILQVIAWKMFHWVGIGYVLWAQSHWQWFSRQFTDRGATFHEAFTNWKGIYNLSMSMNHVVFIGCAFRLATYSSWSDFFAPVSMAAIFFGAVLIMINVWSSMSTFSVVGEFGWYYGDFFIPQHVYTHKLVYTGVYRFLNNPDCVTGHAASYGLALIAQSWWVFGLALFSQMLNIWFLNLVEIPHMKMLYSHQVRHRGPLNRVLEDRIRHLRKKLIPDSDRMEKEMRQHLRRIRSRALKEMFALYKKMDMLKNDMKQKIQNIDSPNQSVATRSDEHKHLDRQRQITRISVDSDTICVGHPLTVHFVTTKSHSDTDWLGVYPVDQESVPGMSHGKWRCVPRGAQGDVKFVPSKMPSEPGVYHVRYHTDGGYDSIASVLLQLTEASDYDDDGDYKIPEDNFKKNK